MNVAASSTAHNGSHSEGHGDPSLRAKIGMACFLISEAAFFSTLIMAYVIFMFQPQEGPNAANSLSLSLPLIGTVFLVSSSMTIHLAIAQLEKKNLNFFELLMTASILLGAAFLVSTGFEWHELIYHKGVTIGRNLFGTTYFTLIGFHAFHVSLGVIAMLVVLTFSAYGHIGHNHSIAIELVGWYWHFVDAVWILLLFIVYFSKFFISPGVGA